jgi:zinc protease
MTAVARPDSITIEATAVSESTGSLLILISDILRSAEFPEREVDDYRRGRSQFLRNQSAQPAAVATRLLGLTLFGPSGYGAAVDPPPEAMDALDRQALLDYRASVFVPGNTTLLMIGKLPAHAELMKALTYVFAAWSEKKPPPYVPPKPPEAKRRLLLVDRPGAPQAEIRVGRVAPALSNAETLPLQIASTIAGGSPQSRLATELHDTLRPGEDVHTEIDPMADSGAFSAIARVRNEIAGDVLQKVLAEMDRVANEPIDPTDLANAKAYTTGSVLLRLESQQNLADTIAVMKLAGLPKDYLDGYTARVNAIDAAQVQAAAKKWMAADNAAVIVVGDAAKIREQLAKVGTFELVSAGTGQPAPAKP